MGISGIGGGGASQSAAQMSAMREKMVARMQQEMDVDGNGSVSKDEFGQADKRMRADAPNGAPKNAPSADEVFSKADLDGDQSLSTEELTKLADSMKRKETQLLERIQRAELAAVEELRHQAADLAAKSAEVLLHDAMGKRGAKLVDEAIGDLSTRAA